MTRWLVTGGYGFIGSNLVRMILAERPNVEIVNFDALTYAGNPRNVESAVEAAAAGGGAGRYHFRRGDLTDHAELESLFREEGPFDAVLHLAAESHVDRSIESAHEFVTTNVVGTQMLLDHARRREVPRFLHVSTDEVYGALPLDQPALKFTEATPLSPRSPYSASKAASDFLALAAHHTHGMDVVVTRCSNNYGPYQFPEKLIPLMILRAAANETMPVYGDGLYVRDWIHVEDHCRGLLAALERGRAGEVYNFGGDNEWPNIKLVRELLAILEKPESLIRHVEDRKGHDRRYAVDATKAKSELGWQPTVDFPNGLRATVEWYRANADWVQSILTKDYQDYIRRHYGGRREA
jgi:dTDP-glucose 4,6-dehydratase